MVAIGLILIFFIAGFFGYYVTGLIVKDWKRRMGLK